MKKNYKLLDFDILGNLDILRSRHIIIWGAAARGIQMKRTLIREHFDIRCFCDSDYKKWGNRVDETEVISPYRLKKELEDNPNIVVVSSMTHEPEMVRILREFKMPIVSLVSYWGMLTACIAGGCSCTV